MLQLQRCRFDPPLNSNLHPHTHTHTRTHARIDRFIQSFNLIVLKLESIPGRMVILLPEVGGGEDEWRGKG